MDDDSKILSEDIVSITPAPKNTYYALFVNEKNRSLDKIEVPFFGIYTQRWDDDTEFNVTYSLIVENDGSLMPASSFEDFIGVVSKEDLENGLPRWAVEDLADYLREVVDS